MLLEGKTCVITGAATQSGIGFSAAKLLAAQGAKLAILDIDGSAALEAARALPGSHHVGYRADVANRAHCEEAMKDVAAQFKSIDILINNAGVTRATKFLDITQEEYALVLNVNLTGTLNMCQAVLPHMIARKSGSIVNISSAAAQRGGGFFGGAHYCAAKAGVLGLTKSIAREFGPVGVRANAICPSMVETNLFAGAMTDEKRAELRAAVPMGRLGRPEDIAGACLFLASDLAGYVTGSELDVNGGTHIH
jgi:NAD(P)-dependent dehydrogenase (short-subunit alcohol dehydrogenase family)